MFWTRNHQIESSNHEGFFKNFPCCRQFLQKFYKVKTNFVGFFHARCLNFPCFMNYLAACMHAFCMFYLYVSLGNTSGFERTCDSVFQSFNICSFSTFYQTVPPGVPWPFHAVFSCLHLNFPYMSFCKLNIFLTIFFAVIIQLSSSITKLYSQLSLPF